MTADSASPLATLRATVIDDRFKGIPGGVEPFPLRAIGDKKWNVLRQDLPLPLMTLKQSALDHNVDTFMRFVNERGLSLAPHGKTTMAPQLFHRQLAAGAWGMTAATVSQVQVYRSFGIGRVLLANQLIGAANIRYVADQLNADPEFDFYCFVDSPAGVGILAAELRDRGLRRPLKLLLEGGMAGGRSGCRTTAEARATLAAIRAATDVVTLAGVAGFEGLVPDATPESLRRVDEYLAFLAEVAALCEPADFAGVDEIVLTAGGSAFFDRVDAVLSAVTSSLPVRLVVRSGCYLTSDAGIYKGFLAAAHERGWPYELQPALEIWSYVQSTPEAGLALLTMGKRDAPYDVGMPIPKRRYVPGAGWAPPPAGEVAAMNDQHAFLRLADDQSVDVGDMIACGISHPCTAFDKWRLIPVVDDEYTVVDAVLTFF